MCSSTEDSSSRTARKIFQPVRRQGDTKGRKLIRANHSIWPTKTFAPSFITPWAAMVPGFYLSRAKIFLIFLLTFPLCQGVSYPQEPVPKTK